MTEHERRYVVTPAPQAKRIDLHVHHVATGIVDGKPMTIQRSTDPRSPHFIPPRRLEPAVRLYAPGAVSHALVAPPDPDTGPVALAEALRRSREFEHPVKPVGFHRIGMGPAGGTLEALEHAYLDRAVLASTLDPFLAYARRTDTHPEEPTMTTPQFEGPPAVRVRARAELRSARPQEKILEASEDEAIDFILVAIKRPDGYAGRDRNPHIAVIRRAIHDASEEYDVPVTDMAYVQGVKKAYGRIPIASAHAALRSVYEHLTAYVEDFRASRPVTEPLRQAQEARRQAEQKRHRHRARAIRAADLITRYIGLYGDDLPKGKPTGRRAKP